ncbi:NAD(P)-dependent oxidoreductase [Aquabacterium sp.]|uniref:NAD(P)-dependent oxidoreductase n=1 Tax=Aquabacterium sp. TaxID=1872578 RepID=UPI002C3AE14F|nr:NAD(P)-dependent oxidoreductase [Aquabacterium sp.]HSW08620.1 NAD(P)-dependent oxidoreductase [Aquabacterium sp.]
MSDGSGGLTQPSVGVIGVGNMGLGMALRLLDTGHAVRVHDLLPEREVLAVQAGASRAASAAALAQHCSVVAVVVVNAAQAHEVLFGAAGVVQAARRPQAVLLCPTIAPADVEQMACGLAEHGIACIDAPMSGGPARARDGSMSLMVGCEQALFEQHRVLLQALGAQLFHVGPKPGDGARTKLVNNLLAAVNLAGAAEAIALAQRLGLDAVKTLQVIEQSSGQSWIGSDRMARALAGDLAPRAHTTLLAKDSALAIAMAQQTGIDPQLGTQAAAMFRAACEAGHADEDDGSLLNYVAGCWSSVR